MAEPAFSIGIEEEYLLVDRETCALVEAPPALMEACVADLAGQVSPEFLQCQIEIGTRPCTGVAEARDDLRRLRASVSRHAADHGLSPIAASCHPLADWKTQHHTDKQRYNDLSRDLGGVVQRMLICGMHVHVGLDDDPLRADLMAQASYFLPHLLALSASSPFWQGRDTRLASYRLTVFDNLPRTGLPPQFDTWQEYDRSTQILVDTGAIEDRTRIWWDLRPSDKFPTLEARIMDVQPRLEHALMLAGLIQCILRMLWRLRVRNQRWRNYDRFLIGENRWRAQRYGVRQGLIDFGAAEVVPFPKLMDELLSLIEEDAAHLKCLPEVARAREIAAEGTSSDRQRRVREEAEAKGLDAQEQMRAVVQHLIEEFHADL